MLFWIIHFLLIIMLVLAKELLREDLLHCSVPKAYTAMFIVCTILLRLCFLLEQSNVRTPMLSQLLLSLLRGLFLIIPLLLIYLVKKLPGPADIKYCFCIAVLLKTQESYSLIILASFWALCTELLRHRRKKHEARHFAFLPYLISVTLPFIFMKYWSLGGYYGQNK